MKKSIIAFVTLILLASCNNNTSKPTTHYGKYYKKRYFVYQRILDNKLVAIDTIKMDGNSSLKAI
jgi:hypothetical protein